MLSREAITRHAIMALNYSVYLHLLLFDGITSNNDSTFKLMYQLLQLKYLLIIPLQIRFNYMLMRNLRFLNCTNFALNVIDLAFEVISGLYPYLFGCVVVFL